MVLIALDYMENEVQRNEMDRFYEENKVRLFAIARKYLHNEYDAEDAVQETFLRIAKKPDKFFALNNAERIGYVCAIVKNISIDMAKNNTKYQTEELSEDLIFQNDFEPLENSLFNKISHDEILSFINNLPPLQHSVLVLTCLYGFSISETSQALKISEKSVNQRLYLARKSIKKFIAERSKRYE